jgi:hypothetical protein
VVNTQLLHPIGNGIRAPFVSPSFMMVIFFVDVVREDATASDIVIVVVVVVPR